MSLSTKAITLVKVLPRSTPSALDGQKLRLTKLLSYLATTPDWHSFIKATGIASFILGSFSIPPLKMSDFSANLGLSLELRIHRWDPLKIRYVFFICQYILHKLKYKYIYVQHITSNVLNLSLRHSISQLPILIQFSRSVICGAPNIIKQENLNTQ